MGSEGRIVTMVFATILIPMNIYFHYLCGLGLRMLLSFWLFPIYRSCKRRQQITNNADPTILPAYLVSTTLSVILLVFIIFILVFFMHYQDLSFLEAFYMIFMSLTTIGYGDYIPNYYTD